MCPIRITKPGGMQRIAAGGWIAGLLSGCAPALPGPPVPPAFPGAPLEADAAAAGLSWQQYFTDPALQRLIQLALDNNRDLRSALLRVEEARSAFGIQRSSLYPGLDLGVQGARARVPGGLNASDQPAIGAEYRAELGLNNWELDLWGRVRSLNEAALRQWLASEAGARAARTALVAQVADGYLGLREADERVALAQRTVDSRLESVRIFRRRFEVGSASKLELTQVQMLLTQAQTALAQLEQARALQANALQLLAGADPALPPAAAPFDQAVVLPPLAPGLPSGLLASRPDILAAEHRLRAADANIAAARAAFFPRIALTGAFGSASAELDGLFGSGSRAWTFAPVLSLPLFDGGRRTASLQLSEVRREIAVADYEKIIQAAFREVADALAARRWLARQAEVQRTALEVAAERARLAKLRYDSGSSAYLEVLDAQRELFAAEQQLVQSRRALLSSQVQLYAALGGGSADALPSPSTR